MNNGEKCSKNEKTRDFDPGCVTETHPIPTTYVFGARDDAPVDLLHHAAAVTRFLAETSDSFTSDGGGAGLSAEAAFGLALVLGAVEDTINAAIKGMKTDD